MWTKNEGYIIWVLEIVYLGCFLPHPILINLSLIDPDPNIAEKVREGPLDFFLLLKEKRRSKTR